ncbi:hypothetical protein NEISICOT_00120 [Neisseria sicca ATCC 29256]|uniref:Uncharacterized protein n=1 Tax=Neisseria sicca ATCC 29256 TaxID=547045 RepID=C6M0U5_NEISI|nr:hypothetical protein NEISICOT_00120 [Neisseria sicca ATCC 29256]
MYCQKQIYSQNVIQYHLKTHLLSFRRPIPLLEQTDNSVAHYFGS